jgi:hypothetical protein
MRQGDGKASACHASGKSVSTKCGADSSDRTDTKYYVQTHTMRDRKKSEGQSGA